MTKVLIITGSVRPNSVNRKIVELVKAEVSRNDDAELQMADLGGLNLPFFDGSMPPSADGFEITHDSVRLWSEQVKSADAIIFVSPEYNHGLSGIQKNAIDWLFNEWTNKPVLFVAYGWYAGANTLTQLREISTVIKWQALESSVGLAFTKDIDLEGNVIGEGVNENLAKAVKELLAVG